MDRDTDNDIKAFRDLLAEQEARLCQVRESMAAVQARLEAVAGRLENITGENGMPRCARHDERIAELLRAVERVAELPGSGKTCVGHTERLNFLERKLDTLCGRLWWFAGSVSLAVIGMGLRMFWTGVFK